MSNDFIKKNKIVKKKKKCQPHLVDIRYKISCVVLFLYPYKLSNNNYLIL